MIQVLHSCRCSWPIQQYEANYPASELIEAAAWVHQLASWPDRGKETMLLPQVHIYDDYRHFHSLSISLLIRRLNSISHVLVRIPSPIPMTRSRNLTILRCSKYFLLSEIAVDGFRPDNAFLRYLGEEWTDVQTVRQENQLNNVR